MNLQRLRGATVVAATEQMAGATTIATGFSRLFWWRLRHVASAGFLLLMRRWQAVILVLFTISPQVMPLAEQLQILATPVLTMLKHGAPATTLGVWLLLLGLAAAWSALQPHLLAGGAPWAYLRTLPVPRHLTRRVDLAVFAVTDLPLLLPFGAAAFTLLHGASTPGVQACLAATLALASQLPLIQLLGIERSRWLLVALAGPLVGLLTVAFGASAWLLVACIAASSTLALIAPDAGRSVRQRPPMAPPRALRLRRWSAPLAQLARIDLRFLLDPARLGRQVGLLTCVALPVWLTWLLPRLGVEAIVLPYVLLMLLVPLVFSLAGRAFDLRSLHAPMAALHATQGISARATAAVGLAVLLALGSLALLPLALALQFSLGSACALWLLPAGLLALLGCASLNYRGDGMFIPKLLFAASPAVLLTWRLLG